MRFDSFSDFLYMDGHGLFVWLCYGAGLIIFVSLFFSPRLRKKQIVRELYARQNRSKTAPSTGFQIDEIEESGSDS